MKKLEKLKQEILDNKINNFYVFYGEDYGIRRHYIHKIGEQFDSVSYVNNYQEISNRTVTSGLFVGKDLIVLYGDEEFYLLRAEQIHNFINRLDNCTVIVDYEELPESSVLFKEFGDYVTYFPEVNDNIAVEFVDSEVNLLNKDEKVIAKDCNNNYNNILLETDKIKSYSNQNNVSMQIAYTELDDKNQLLRKIDEFNINLFMNDVLTHNVKNYPYWTFLVQNYYSDTFWTNLGRIFNDFLTAYLVKCYGKYEGSSRAYNLKLPWYRAKEIRELPIYEDKDFLLYCADIIAYMDLDVKSGKVRHEEVFDRFLSFLM